MRLILGSIVLLLVIITAIADEDDVGRFNAAYRAYTAAVASGDADLTIVSAQEALNVGNLIFEVGDPRLAALTHNYGNALVEGGRVEEGRDVLKRSIDLLIDSSGKNEPELITYYASLATAFAGFGNESQQLKWYKRALKVAENNYGIESVEYANVAYEAAMNVFQQSVSPAGEKYLKRSLATYEEKFGASSQQAGFANYWLGRIEYYRRDNRDAIEYLLNALSAFGGDTDGEKAQRLLIRVLLVQSYEALNESDNATKHCVAIGRDSQFSPNQDYVPLFRAAPEYPHSQLRQGIEGHVDLKFTVDENGFVRNPVVIEEVSDGRINGFRSVLTGSQGKAEYRSFEAAAMAAVERFRYAPRFVDGVAVPVEGVKTRISFQIVD